MTGRLRSSRTGAVGPSYDVAVVTSAALPWRTGPAFFSLWHAGGLKALGYRVVYSVPFVPPEGQRLWGGPVCETPADQAALLHQEAERLGVPPLPEIRFYRAISSRILRSIVPQQDVFRAAPPARAIVLHEPEHLAWPLWSLPRRRIAADVTLGIVMTNYEDYVRRALPRWAEPVASLVTGLHRCLLARHVDIAVPLSGACAAVAATARRKTVDARVTGVVAPYFRVPPVQEETRGVYFLGRLVWDKGLAEVVDLARETGLPVDAIGAGPDADAIRAYSGRRGAPVTFLGPSEDPWTLLPRYRVFLNPSLSEVLCTATAEALVAGRHAVLPVCPANEPFRAYPNVHFYDSREGAVAALRRAVATLPEPPTAARRDFDWMNACRTVADLCGLSSAPTPPPVGRSGGAAPAGGVGR